MTLTIHVIPVFRPNLMKRLMAVEKRSKTPEEERSQCAGELREAKLVELRAVRVHDSLLLDGLGRPINVKENEARVDIRSYGTSSKGTSSTNQLEPDPVCRFLDVTVPSINCYYSLHRRNGWDRSQDGKAETDILLMSKRVLWNSTKIRDFVGTTIFH